MMRSAFGVVVFTCATACAQPTPAPFPDGKDAYVGDWSVPDDGTFQIIILDDARVAQSEQRDDGSVVELKGAIVEWRDDNFVVDEHEFEVSETPEDRIIDDARFGHCQWTVMTIDDHEVWRDRESCRHTDVPLEE